MSRMAASVVENDWAEQNTLHEGEEHGELVCSAEATVNVRIVVVS
jgi:hypothetical protein